MGRQEYLSGSDQDNALVWVHTDGDLDAEREYYLNLGKQICASLQSIGMSICPGNVMASNPLWNAPFHEWEERLKRAIGEPEPVQLLELETFLDFRGVAGSKKVCDDLRKLTIDLAKAEPSFYLHLAQDLRKRKVGGSNPRRTSPSYVKELSAVLSSFTRLYALKNNIRETNTFDRLEALANLQIFKIGTKINLCDAFEAILSTRLTLTFESPSGQAEPMIPGIICERDEKLLSFTVEQATLLQKRIGFDFLGSVL